MARAAERQSAIVSWKFWQEKLGVSPDASSRSIWINGVDHSVVGVLPETFVPPYCRSGRRVNTPRVLLDIYTSRS